MDERPGTSDRDERPLVAASPFAVGPAIAIDATAAIAAPAQTSWEQFVWQDSDPDDVPSSDMATAPPDGSVPREDKPAAPTASIEEGAHHAAVAPPIAATSPPPLPLDAAERHELWRRQLLTALKDVDDDSPIPAPSRGLAASPPPAVYALSPRRASSQQRAALDHPLDDNTPSAPMAWRMAGRAAAIAAVVVCVFSTGALWATFRPAPTPDTNPLTAATAAIHQVPAAADESDIRPIVNKPVLVRESEAPPPAPHVEMPPAVPHAAPMPSTPHADALPPMPAVGHSTWRQPPAAPSPPPIQMTPRSTPLIINRPVTAFTVPAAPAAEAQRQTEPKAAEPTPAALPRAAATLSPRERGAISETGPRRSASAGAAARVSSEAYQASGPEAPHARTTQRPKWDNRRQGLRTAAQPEPEPSTLKKLLNAVWPASSGDKGSPAKSAPSAEPAPPVQPHNWSDLASPDP